MSFQCHSYKKTPACGAKRTCVYMQRRQRSPPATRPGATERLPRARPERRLSLCEEPVSSVCPYHHTREARRDARARRLSHRGQWAPRPFAGRPPQRRSSAGLGLPDLASSALARLGLPGGAVVAQHAKVDRGARPEDEDVGEESSCAAAAAGPTRRPRALRLLRLEPLNLLLLLGRLPRLDRLLCPPLLVRLGLLALLARLLL
mmetsp:Transcript_19942/g.64042  ORF Transcript_19942/g.64042 Transcript_19942/m.64042 type:complete len:204 (-) Transcript_19942:391-1002(-)